MTKILEGMTALFLLISGAFYNYDYNKTALIFLCLVIVLSLTTLFSIRSDIKKSKAKKDEINLQEFTFVDPPGYYTHPKYSYPICPACLINKGRISPVSKVDENAWYCNVCNEPMSGSRGEVFTIPD